MKHLYLLLLLFLAALAQGHAENVRGRVIDEHSGEPLPDATVQIVIEYARAGRNIYRLTLDSLGCFCREVSGDDCRVEVSLIGYHSRKVHFVAMEGTDTLDLGDIRLKPSDVYLRTATVNARAKRFVMRGDTVVFNPDAFQLSEGARLDELIRQLPGVTQKDGKLYWMDKPVRILVNGENMFADNDILQQRLPAEAVDRIKAYNKASKLAESSGRDDGEEDHVLDIQVKPSFLEKWYGSAEANYVTPDRFRALLDAMYFSMSDPFMAYANINTTGQNTFQKNYGSTSWQNAPTFGRQQFGSLGYKHAWKHPGEKKELTNQYTFCIEGQHLDTWDRSGQSRETFLTSGPNAYSLSASHSYNHQVYPRFSFSNNLELTERTQFYANASWEFVKQDAPETRRQATFEGDPYAATDDPLEGAFAVTDAEALARGVVARSLYEAQRHTEQMKTKGWATLIHNFGKASSVSVNASADYADTQVSALALRDLRYFRSPADNVVRYEADREPGHRLKLGGGGNLKVWLGEPVLLTASYDFSYLRDFAARRHAVGDEAFASAENFPAEAIDEANSFAKRFSSGTHWMQTSLQLTLGKVKMTPRLRLSAAHENLQYHRGALDVDATRNLWLWNPALEARWNVKRGQNVELSYSYDTKAPDMLDRVDFTDDTNPLYIVEGNPMLRNSHSHSASLRYFANIMRLQQSITATLRLTKQVDPIATLLSFQPPHGCLPHAEDERTRGLRPRPFARRRPRLRRVYPPPLGTGGRHPPQLRLPPGGLRRHGGAAEPLRGQLPAPAPQPQLRERRGQRGHGRGGETQPDALPPLGREQPDPAGLHGMAQRQVQVARLGVRNEPHAPRTRGLRYGGDEPRGPGMDRERGPQGARGQGLREPQRGRHPQQATLLLGRTDGHGTHRELRPAPPPLPPPLLPLRLRREGTGQEVTSPHPIPRAPRHGGFSAPRPETNGGTGRCFGQNSVLLRAYQSTYRS